MGGGYPALLEGVVCLMELGQAWVEGVRSVGVSCFLRLCFMMTDFFGFARDVVQEAGAWLGLRGRSLGVLGCRCRLVLGALIVVEFWIGGWCTTLPTNEPH